jgi:DNA topoisomerase-1
MPKTYSKTSTYLVIVESPAKCKKIEDYLGPGYKCVASFGHLRELKSLKNIDVKNNFEPTFTNIENSMKLKRISELRKEIDSCDDVILATDDDREGEAIAWHICMMFNLNIEKTKRIVFHEITENAIQQAIRNPRRVDMNIVHAQQARQILDLLVGFKISPSLWKYISKNADNSLSAGRCQTPALRLIYENQKEIEQNPGIKKYNTIGYFTNQCIAFDLSKKYENDDELIDFLERSINFTHVYSCSQPVKVYKIQPEPFTTSRLQQSASNDLRVSPKETMRLCQTLYEAGYITYMRTDSKTYSKDFIESAKKYIDSVYGANYINKDIDQLASNQREEKRVADATKEKKKVPSKKLSKSDEDAKKPEAQEAHEAIRPTNIFLKDLPDKIGSKEKHMYKVIWENTLESCMEKASFYSIVASISASLDNKSSYTSENVDFLGWKIVKGKCESYNKDYHYLLQMKQPLELPCKKVQSRLTLTNTKMHYTEAKLVQLLEENGIGRPSTFSSLVDKIQERGYVKKEDIQGHKIKCSDYELENGEIFEIETTREFGNEKNKLVIQQVGALVSQFLDKNFSALFNYDYTKEMENALDKIAKGEKVWHEVCADCLEQIEALINELKETGEGKREIRIDDRHVYTIGKFGPVIKCMDEDGDGISFKPIKKDIDLDKLEAGEYKLEDILAEKTQAADAGKVLGQHEGEDVLLKNGKFGLYVTWGKNTKSLKCFGNRPVENISFEDIVKILDKDGNLVREVSPSISIRNGKFGRYIFYKTPKMKKPIFHQLSGFTNDVELCDINTIREWIEEKYKIH